MKLILTLLAVFISFSFFSQTLVEGEVQDEKGRFLEWVDVIVEGMNKGATTNEDGKFSIADLPRGSYNLISRTTDFYNDTIRVTLTNEDPVYVVFKLKPVTIDYDEIVVSGTMRAARKSDSPVPIEVYSKEFFRSNPAPSIFESLRSEEHTSELQSRPHLVCRLLL